MILLPEPSIGHGFSFVGCSLLERFCQKPPSDTAISLYRCSSLDISCLSYHRILTRPEVDGEFVPASKIPHHPCLTDDGKGWKICARSTPVYARKQCPEHARLCQEAVPGARPSTPEASHRKPGALSRSHSSTPQFPQSCTRPHPPPSGRSAAPSPCRRRQACRSR